MKNEDNVTHEGATDEGESVLGRRIRRLYRICRRKQLYDSNNGEFSANGQLTIEKGALYITIMTTKISRRISHVFEATEKLK